VSTMAQEECETMGPELGERLKASAHFVAGRRSWLREDDDPRVEIAVQDAITFINKICDEMPSPQIAGGTSNRPSDILTLYWVIAGVQKIIGIYVTFNGDHTCNVIWNEPDGSSHHLERISIEELLNLDIAGKYRNLQKRVSLATN
jgi:hypothetical protein